MNVTPVFLKGNSVPSRLLYILLLCVLVTSVPALADIVFTDTTFNISTDYTQTPLYTDTNVSASYLQCISCGNPGQALQVVVTIPDTLGGAFVGFLNNTFVYNPQSEGAILSLSTSVDKYVSLSSSSTDFASNFYPLIEQGGSYYILQIPGGTINSGTTLPYETISSQTLNPSGLVATDFTQFDFSTQSSDGTHPNFSATGASMTFGLAPLVSANAPYTITANYDNLNFDIIPDTQGGITQSAVPESSSLGLLSIFLMGLLLRGLGPAVRWKLKRQ